MDYKELDACVRKLMNNNKQLKEDVKRWKEDSEQAANDCLEYFYKKGIKIIESMNPNMCHVYDKKQNLIYKCKGLLNYNNKIILVRNIPEILPELCSGEFKYLYKEMEGKHYDLVSGLRRWRHMITTKNTKIAEEAYIRYFKDSGIYLVEKNKKHKASYAYDKNMNLICKHNDSLFFGVLELLDKVLEKKPELKTEKWAELKNNLDVAREVEFYAWGGFKKIDILGEARKKREEEKAKNNEKTKHNEKQSILRRLFHRRTKIKDTEENEKHEM